MRMGVGMRAVCRGLVCPRRRTRRCRVGRRIRIALLWRGGGGSEGICGDVYNQHLVRNIMIE
jgi:hypothetical protein